MLAIQISQREVTKVFSLREKVKVLDLRKEKKNHMLRLVPSLVRPNLCEIVKKEKEIHATFAVAPQTAEVTA